MKASTLKYVADKLGVSVSTVSRAVNNKEYVKEETRQRVIEALKEYNYVPNDIARSLKLQSSMTIGVVIPDICEVFFGEIIKGIDSVVAAEGYTIIVADTNESKKNEKKYLEMLYQKRIDALVLATVDLDGNSVKQYLHSSIPVVFIDNIPRLNSIDSITIDNRLASKMAVKALIEQGHTKIATIIGLIEETTGYERMQGYKEALEEASIPYEPELVKFGNYKEEDGFRCMNHLLNNFKEYDFTGLYVTSEMMTFGAIKAIHEHELNIPQDISLVGFDVHDKAGLVNPTIATIRQPETLIGKRTGELLLRRLKAMKEEQNEENIKNEEKREIVAEKILLQPSLMEGKSVRKL